MNISKHKILMLTAITLLILAKSLFGQKLEPKERITEVDHTLNSEIMGRDYQLYIYFPPSYSTEDTISYPVLYFLDGRYSFPIIRGTMNLLDEENELEEVIIVGIGSGLDVGYWFGRRTYDYTFSNDSSSIYDFEKQYNVPEGVLEGGGADKFIEFIKNEVAVFVDKNYKTNSDRGIAGFSLGGLFTAYCFVNSDGYFTRFGIGSPSFWWENNKLLEQAVSQFYNEELWDLPPTKVFISVGDKESRGIFPTTVKFATYLKYSEYENIDLTFKIFEGETHLSVWPITIIKTITNLYGR